MTGRQRNKTALLGLWLVGCGSMSSPLDFALELCPSGTASNVIPCELVADGRSLISVRAFVKTELALSKRNDSLQAKFVISNGTWVGADAGTPLQKTLALGPELSAVATFTPDTHPGPLLIDVTLDKALIHQWITLAPAPLAGISVIAEPAVLSGTAPTTIVLTPQLRVPSGGQPSHGTQIDLAVTSIDPMGATAVLTSERLVVGEAQNTVSLYTSQGIKSVLLKLTATPKRLTPSDPVPPSVTTELKLAAP